MEVLNQINRHVDHSSLIREKLIRAMEQDPKGRRRYFNLFNGEDVELCVSHNTMDRVFRNRAIRNVWEAIHQVTTDAELQARILGNIRSAYEYHVNVGPNFPAPPPEIAHDIAFDLGVCKIYIWSLPVYASYSKEAPQNMGFELNPEIFKNLKEEFSQSQLQSPTKSMH